VRGRLATSVPYFVPAKAHSAAAARAELLVVKTGLRSCFLPCVSTSFLTAGSANASPHTLAPEAPAIPWDAWQRVSHYFSRIEVCPVTVWGAPGARGPTCIRAYAHQGKTDLGADAPEPVKSLHFSTEGDMPCSSSAISRSRMTTCPAVRAPCRGLLSPW
jgi:hypothetical protein